MTVGHRLGSWMLAVSTVAALAAVGPPHVAAANSGPSPSHAPASSSHASTPSLMAPFLPLTAKQRPRTKSLTLKRGGSTSATRLAIGASPRARSITLKGATSLLDSRSKTSAAPVTASTLPDHLIGFPGTSQADTIHNFGIDQAVTPPNEDVAAGPTDVSRRSRRRSTHRRSTRSATSSGICPFGAGIPTPRVPWSSKAPRCSAHHGRSE